MAPNGQDERSELAIGDVVLIHSLQGAKELNGRHGKIVKFVEETLRFGVKLDGEKAPKALKAANLRRLEDVAKQEKKNGDELIESNQISEALACFETALKALENCTSESTQGTLLRGILESKAHCHFIRKEWWDVVIASERACPFAKDQNIGVLLRVGTALRELGLLHTAEEKLKHAVARKRDGESDCTTAPNGADPVSASTDAVAATEATDAHQKVLAAIEAIEEGQHTIVMDEIDRLRVAIPEQEAVRWMHTAKVHCESDKGRQEMIGNGFLKPEWLNSPQASYTARTMHKLLLYQVKKKLQQELSVLPGAGGPAGTGVTAQYTFATPVSLRHPGATQLLREEHFAELRDRGITTVDQAFDTTSMIKLRQECEMLDKMGILLRDDEDICNPLQRKFDLPLGDRAAVEASRKDAPVMFEIIYHLLGLPVLLEEKLGLHLRVPESVMLACYPQGAFYRKHLDSYEGKDIPRKVTTILYCNPDWVPEDGGNLRAWVKGEPIEFTPTAGRLVVFMAQDIWHEVTESKKDRYAISHWIWDVKKDDLGR